MEQNKAARADRAGVRLHRKQANVKLVVQTLHLFKADARTWASPPATYPPPWYPPPLPQAHTLLRPVPPFHTGKRGTNLTYFIRISFSFYTQPIRNL